MTTTLSTGSSALTRNTPKKFSIFNPAVTLEHREFYEQISGKLNAIFPICSQGESAAVEISENETEQQQVTDLMKQVESFAQDLISLTKDLFDQFYQAKEELYTSILTTTAFNMINLVDRNLLERTCDVRWWALETAFSDCLSQISSVKKLIPELLILLEEVLQDNNGSNKIENQDERAILMNLTTSVKESLEDPILFFVDKRKGTEIKENLDHIIHISNEKGTSNLVKKIKRFLAELDLAHQKVIFASDRLEDINNSYTLYRDLVIVDNEGFIIANSDKKNRKKRLGVRVNDEIWFQKALETLNGTEYYVQDVCPSKLEDQDSLVYSTAVRENSDENGNVIGAMGVFFDFQGESKIILNEYVPHDKEGDIMEGCYSLFTNEKGVIIASSDEIILELTSYAHLPKNHRNLHSGQRYSSYAVFEGAESAILSAKTEGYLEYKGLGWSSHMIIPKTEVFKSDTTSLGNLNVSKQLLMNSKLIPEVNKRTYIKVEDDKESIQLISLNGIVFASKLGKQGVSLGPIFEQITKTGDFAPTMMEELLAEMGRGVLNLHLKSLENFSKQAIDLIDRNLFERAADIRWWSTDKYFWNALQNPSDENYKAAANRLRVINSSYTMYRNLVLIDGNGDFVACSRNEFKNELKQKNYSNTNWFQEGMRTIDSNRYCVNDVNESVLESKKEVSLIYIGGVRANGERKGESIGVLAIMFDWDKEAKQILETCLPRDNQGELIEGAVAFYTNQNKGIIETTDPEKYPVGKKMDLPESVINLEAGESVSNFITYKETEYIMGSSRTKGYREYEGLGWVAHILRPVY